MAVIGRANLARLEGSETERLIMAEVRSHAPRFNRSWFEDPEALLRARTQAMTIVLEGYERGKRQKRYVAGALPRLAFAADAFDLCVCSHLLFLYADQLTLDFHRRGIAELLRLTPEVRVYPLRDLSHALSPHLEPVCHEASIFFEAATALAGFRWGRPLTTVKNLVPMKALSLADEQVP